MYSIRPVNCQWQHDARQARDPHDDVGPCQLRTRRARLSLVNHSERVLLLQHTFCHAPGLGPQNERLLWEKGLHTWRDVLWAEEVPLTPQKADALIDTARRSTHHLSERNPHFFYENLPTREHWRMFGEFRGDTAYFDIETTGLDNPDDHITTIVLYDGQIGRAHV